MERMAESPLLRSFVLGNPKLRKMWFSQIGLFCSVAAMVTDMSGNFVFHCEDQPERRSCRQNGIQTKPKY